MKTLGEVLHLSADFLKKRGIERPRLQVEELLSSILHMPRIELYMQYDRPMIEEELAALREAVKRRGQREPWQYIAGEVEFLGCRIRLSRSVLIPRQETEILADRIIKELPAHALDIWDLCTGSGCLGIALKKKRPDCRVAVSDISAEALQVARENSLLNGVEIEVVQGDLLDPFEGRRTDVIVCNPPYVSEDDFAHLDPEVKEWEPKLALVVATGLEFYDRLSPQLPHYLNASGKVYFELGKGMGEKVKNLFNSPVWVKKEVFQDWSSHDRYLVLEIQ